MDRLNELPDEILDDIIVRAGEVTSNLNWQKTSFKDGATLRNLALTCSKIHHLAAPYLFAKVSINLGSLRSISSPYLKGRERTSVLASRSLFDSRNTMAAFVRSLTVSNGLYRVDPYERQHSDDGKLRRLLKGLSYLEELDATHYGTSTNWTTLFSPPITQPRFGPLFFTLHTLRLDIGDSDIADLLHLFLLPKAVNLTLRHGQCSRPDISPQHKQFEESDWVKASSKTPNSTLKHLTFTDLAVPQVDMCFPHIGAVCTGLTCLTVVRSGFVLNRLPGLQPKFPLRPFVQVAEEILRAFRPSFDATLRMFEIRDYFPDYNTNYSPGLMNMMAETPRLEELSLDASVFTSLVPRPNLRSMRIDPSSLTDLLPAHLQRLRFSTTGRGSMHGWFVQDSDVAHMFTGVLRALTSGKCTQLRSVGVMVKGTHACPCLPEVNLKVDAYRRLINDLNPIFQPFGVVLEDVVAC